MTTKDFQCSAGHITEHVVTMHTVEVICGEPYPKQRRCTRPAHVIITTVPHVRYMGDGFTGAAKDGRTR